jgi:hypothetical protein
MTWRLPVAGSTRLPVVEMMPLTPVLALRTIGQRG